MHRRLPSTRPRFRYRRRLAVLRPADLARITRLLQSAIAELEAAAARAWS